MLTVDNALPATQESYQKELENYFNAKNFHATASCVEKLIIDNPNNPKFLFVRAFCLLNLKKSAEAIRDLDAALALSPNNGMLKIIYRLKGICHQNLEEIPQAVACYKEAASRGDNYSYGILATVGVIPKKTLSSSYPFDYNIPSTLQETYEDK
jgi:tetratricopeptide (TPR) repeat protein